MRALRIMLAGAAAIAAVAIGVAALAIVALSTTSAGLRLGLRALGETLPGELAFGDVTGDLITGLELDDLRYASDELEIELRRLAIEPALAELAGGRIVLERVTIGDGFVRLAERNEIAREPPAPPKLPAIPDAIAVNDARIENVEIRGLGTGLTILEIAGRLAGSRATFETIELAAPGARATLAGEIDVAGDARGSLAGSVAWQGAAASSADERATNVPSIRIATRFALLTSVEPWRLRVEWDEWVWTGSPAGRLRSGAGNLTVMPGTDPMHLELAAQIEGEALPDDATIVALAQLAEDVLYFEQLAIETLGGTITARGSVGRDARTGDITVEYAGLDPSYVDERLDGQLRGRIDIALASTPERSVTVQAEGGGMLGDRALDTRLRARVADETLEIEVATARLGEGRVEAAGSISADATDVRFTAHLPELASWYPPATGALDAAGTVIGATRNPAVDIEITGKALAWDALPVPAFEALRLALDGTLGSHTLEVHARSELGSVDLAVTQGWVDRELRGTLRAATLDLARAGSWQLASAARYSASATRLALERACYAGPADARLCTVVDGSTLAIDAQALPNALLEPWLPADVEVAGAADLAVELDWEGAPSGSLLLRQPALSLTLAGAAASRTELAAIGDIELAASLTREQLRAELAATWTGGGDAIAGELTLSPPAADGRLTGRLDAELTDLTVVDAFIEGIEALTGRLGARVTVAGSPAQPRIDGRLDVRSLAAAVPPLGIEITDGRLTARAEGSDRLRFSGELCSAGCVRIAGDWQASPQSGLPWRLDATIAGSAFELADLPELQAAVVPELRLRANPEQWHASGTIEITEALAIVDDVPRTAIRPASATVVHGRRSSRDTETPSLPLAFEIGAQLGDVRFEGLGIEAELAGRLDLVQTTDAGLRVQGTTTVEQGTFSAYGQELAIDGGQLIFTGAPDNPALDIRATREVDGAVVGLTLTGTARNPRSVVFSTPALGESEALARLLTGRSLANAAPADPEALERAAIGLGLRRTLPTLDRLGASWGLEELGFAAPGGTEGALVAGKRLGEDLYLRYKHGLFDDFAGLELIYRITERFRLRTETGTAQSIDVIYEVDPHRDDEDVFEDATQSPAGVAAPGD